MTMKISKLKIGFIVDSRRVSQYVYEIAEWAQRQENIEVSHLIIQSGAKVSPDKGLLTRVHNHLREKGLSSLIKVVLWRAIITVEKASLKKTPRYDEHFRTLPLPENIDGLIVVPRASKNGLVYRYESADIEKIRSMNLDLLIRCGSGILRGEILGVCRFGVLSFHHGDNRVNRGGPPGFWEVFYRNPRTGFIIQRLTDELDGGNVLFRGYFPTFNFFILNQANLYRRANYYLKQLLKSIAESGTLPEPEEAFPYSYKLFKVPTIASQLRYITRTGCSAILAKAKRKILRLEDCWGVAFQRRNWRNLVMWKATRITNPPGRFLADPFLISRDGGDYCFVEDYDLLTRRGCISVLKLGESGADSLERIIIEPFHMSFPYFFEYQGKLFIVPETAENMDIRLYECVSFPLKWKLAAIVMSGVSAADTMIFERDGLWWLFTNISPPGEIDHCSELSIFYSTDPTSDVWTEHPMNPIYIDPLKARNGGILVEGKELFRVAQRQGFTQYGAGSRIFHIDKLDKEIYSESIVCEIGPSFFDAKGTHHLHSNGAITVFDYLVEERPYVSRRN